MDSVELDDPQTLNHYSYCGNDPVNSIDPDGLFWGKLWRGIKKILTNKWFMIAVAVALIVISQGWLGPLTKSFFSVQLGGFFGVTQVTQYTTIGIINAVLKGVAIASEIISWSWKGVVQRGLNLGVGAAVGSVVGGLGGGTGTGRTPDWNPDGNDLVQRRGPRPPPRRRGQRGYRGPGSWHYGWRPVRVPPSRPPVSFSGLNQNRPLRELTHNEVHNAFRETLYTPSSHANMQLRSQRTYDLGIRTLNDYANSLNGGIRSGNFSFSGGAVTVTHGRFQTVLNPGTGKIITVRPR